MANDWLIYSFKTLESMVLHGTKYFKI